MFYPIYTGFNIIPYQNAFRHQPGEPGNNKGRTSLIRFCLFKSLTDSNDFFQFVTHIISFLKHAKVAKLVLSGEPDHFQPFGILLKGFLFLKKKDF